MKHVQIVIGSVRPIRIGEQIAGWLHKLVAGFDGVTFEIIDLRDWLLPMDDEPDQPARGGYRQEHTRAWGAKVAAGDGYIFVTPQYNWGYPASLKNALDHLYSEWRGKPSLIVSYGHRGGLRAAAQLRQVLEGLHMKQTEASPGLVFHEEMLDAQRRLADIEKDFVPYSQTIIKSVEELVALF